MWLEIGLRGWEIRRVVSLFLKPVRLKEVWAHSKLLGVGASVSDYLLGPAASESQGFLLAM